VSHLRRHRRRFQPGLCQLEDRRLLTGSAVAVNWLGQDGYDYAGGPQPGVGNGVQDVDLQFTNLPANESIASIVVLGYGGGGWNYKAGPYGPSYSGDLVRSSGSTTADLFVEPYVFTAPKPFYITITYGDQTTATCSVIGQRVDPNLRMPGATVQATWLGQNGQDITNPSQGVGPDGYQDVDLSVSNLSSTETVAGMTLTDASGNGWASWANPGNLNAADYRPSATSSTVSDLYFSPTRDLYGTTYTLTVTYTDGKTDQTTVVAGHTNSTLIASDKPAPASVSWNTISASWLGQDGLNLLGPGDVDLAVSSIPAGLSVVTATLSDPASIDWSYVAPNSGATATDPLAGPLGFRLGANGTTANFTFQPDRDETGSTLTLTLVLNNGATVATRIAGGAVDLGLRRTGISSSSIVAYPGDNLNVLANTYGTVRLVAGTYEMTQPLTLSNPVTITADPGATILFAQPANTTWTAAIKILASHTTLNGFAVRFVGPIQWNPSPFYQPTVIGTRDNLDPWSSDPLVDETLTNLDLVSPPASTSWEQATELIHVLSAANGTISNDTLNGGVTEFYGGPWTITNNHFTGTPQNEFTLGAFAGHSTHDLTLTGNTVIPANSNGKTYRFVALTQSGYNDLIAGNDVVGVGPMNNDTEPNPNAPEIMLTEAYTVFYEGLTSSVSSDGLTVQTYAPQLGGARTGDVLAILSGPQAGQWREITSVLNPTTYVLDAPVTPGTFAVSVDNGFVNTLWLNNTVDARGSSIAGDLILAGNNFGTEVVGNHFLGGNVGFEISAYASEWPVTFGWTHAPALGIVIDSNTIQDTNSGATLGVADSPYIKADGGRVYYSGSFTSNAGIWTAAFVAARAAAGNNSPNVLLTIDDPTAIDPGEVQLTMSGNTVSGPTAVISAPTVVINDGTINGVAQQNVSVVLPVSPTSTSSAPSSSSGGSAPILSAPKPQGSISISLAPVSAPLTIATKLKTALTKLVAATPPRVKPALHLFILPAVILRPRTQWIGVMMAHERKKKRPRSA
jgi:hypothetical protein